MSAHILISFLERKSLICENHRSNNTINKRPCPHPHPSDLGSSEAIQAEVRAANTAFVTSMSMCSSSG